ncbi:hypothetical protein GCM10010468_05650 [Actinocorallia longicatena]|uniref:Secreted protein n=1 Tax=Actinocorallia longicatena TaxID=111803 RepID=A0ABP6PXP3_9ACTN
MTSLARSSASLSAATAVAVRVTVMPPAVWYCVSTLISFGPHGSSLRAETRNDRPEDGRWSDHMLNPRRLSDATTTGRSYEFA